MQDSTTKTSDTASKRLEIGQIGLKNSLKIIVAGALLLAATSATAGLLSSPLGVFYANTELAPVFVQDNGSGSMAVRTTGLYGELILEGSALPPEYEVPASAEVVLTSIQQLDLIIDLAEGTVSGQASMDASSPLLAQFAFVRGTASCLPLSGRDCGQLVVALELRGTLSDPYNPASVGQVQIDMLGSLIWDDTNMMHWAALTGNAALKANEALINSALEYASDRGAL